MTKGPYTARRLARSTDWSDTTLAESQVVYDKTKKSARVGDGATVAGRALGFDNRTQMLFPNQISANADNYAPAGLKDAGVILMSADADHDLTGIDIAQFPDGAVDRYISIAVDSASPGNITIRDQSGNSTATNRFQIGRDLKMTPGSIQLFRYVDGAVNRWVWFGVPAVALTFSPTDTLRNTDVQSALASLQSRFVHVTSVSLNTPPATPALGDAYVVAGSPTGAWSAKAKSIAVCSNAAGPVWAFITPVNDASIVYNRADGAIYRYTASAWTATGSGINDGQITAAKLDNSTAAKQRDFRTTIGAAASEAVMDHSLLPNGGFEGGNEGSASAVSLTATGTMQAVAIVDDCQAWFRGTFVAAMQQVTSPFVGGRYAVKATLSLGQASLGANDELSIVLPVAGTRSARLAYGSASAAKLTIGFWFQAHRTGTYSGSIRNAAKTRSYPFTFTVAAADTPQWVTTTIAGDTGGTWTIDTAAALLVTVCLAGGTSRAGAAAAWGGADYSGATGTTNGVAATSDVFYLGNAIAVPGEELPDSTRAAYGGRPYSAISRPDPAPSALRYVTGTDTIKPTDYGKVLLLNNSSGFTLGASAAATLGAGFWCRFKNVNSGLVTFDPNASETVDGQTTSLMPQGDSGMIVCDGAGFQTLERPAVVLLSGGNVGSVANIVIPLPAGYDKIEIGFSDLELSSTNLLGTISSDGGSTYASTGYQFGGVFGSTTSGSGGTSYTSSGNAAAFAIGSNLIGGTTGAAGKIELFNPSGLGPSGHYRRVQWNIGFPTSSTDFENFSAGFYGSSVALTHFKLAGASGNIWARWNVRGHRGVA